MMPQVKVNDIRGVAEPVGHKRKIGSVHVITMKITGYGEIRFLPNDHKILVKRNSTNRVYGTSPVVFTVWITNPSGNRAVKQPARISQQSPGSIDCVHFGNYRLESHAVILDELNILVTQDNGATSRHAQEHVDAAVRFETVPATIVKIQKLAVRRAKASTAERLDH